MSKEKKIVTIITVITEKEQSKNLKQSITEIGRE